MTTDRKVEGVPISLEKFHARLSNLKSSNELDVVLRREISHAIVQDQYALLIMLAEEAIRYRQWLAGAQTYCHVIAVLTRMQWPHDAVTQGATHAIILSHRPSPRLQSHEDTVLHCFRRSMAALRKEGLDERQQVDWMATALTHLAAPAALGQWAQLLSPGSDHISKGYQSQIGKARRAICKALNLPNNQNSDNYTPRPISFVRTGAIAAAVLVAAALSWISRDYINLPLSSVFFQGRNWLGALLILWPALLVTTWILAYLISSSKACFEQVSPHHLLMNAPLHQLPRDRTRFEGWITTGEIMPFSRDAFFHIFQFIWIPFLVITALLMMRYQSLPAALASLSNSTSATTIARLVESLTPSLFPKLEFGMSMSEGTRALLSSDITALIAAVLAAGFSIRKQFVIQGWRERSSARMYWWDRRISPLEWYTRLSMVGLDMALGAFLFVKLAVVVLVSYQVASMIELDVQYFSPDGAGGFAFILDAFQVVSWLVFLFGVFVIASVYMHWNLPEYRVSDAGLLVAYLALVALAMIPLFILDTRLQSARELMLASLPVLDANPSPDALPATADRIRDINEIRNWTVSAFSLDLLRSPILPLAGQLIFAVTQYFIRLTGGRPLMSNRTAGHAEDGHL